MLLYGRPRNGGGLHICSESMFAFLFSCLWGSMRMSFCTPGHHSCLGNQVHIACATRCVQHFVLVAGPRDMHTFPGLCVAYMSPSHVSSMYMMKLYDPRGCAVLSLHRCAQGHSGRAPLCRDDAADALQVLFVFLHGVVWQNIQYLYIQTLSSASAGHECMCACKPCLCLSWTSTLGLSSLPPSTFHNYKTVSTCLLQVFLTTCTSYRA